MNYIQIPNNFLYPEIEFRLSDGILNYKGNSIIIDDNNYYQKSMDWLNKNILKFEDLVILNFEFNMFCTSSTDEIINILNILKENVSEEKLVINWFYKNGDNDTKEIGEYINIILNIKMNIIER